MNTEEVGIKTGTGPGKKDSPKEVAKRMVIEHDFDHVTRFSDSDLKPRRNVTSRGGYAYPTDMALALIDMYVLSEHSNRQPKIMAASAIYAASRKLNCKEKQRSVALELDTTASSIRRVYKQMLDLMF